MVKHRNRKMVPLIEKKRRMKMNLQGKEMATLKNEVNLSLKTKLDFYTF